MMPDTLHYQQIHSQRSPVHNQEHPSGKKSHVAVLRTIISIIIAILVLILIIEVIFHIFIAPRIVLRHIRLDTDMDMTVEKVKDLGEIETGTLFYHIRQDVIRENLMSDPNIKNAEIWKTFPDTLNIRLIGREPLCILMVEYDGIMLPALVDEEGVVYRIGYDIENWDVPVIQGIKFDTFELGTQVNESYLIMFDDISSLIKDDSNVLHAFSEFVVDEVYTGLYEWLLIPLHVSVRVRASPGLDRDKVLYILKILDVLEQRGIDDIKEIDFRANDVVYHRVGRVSDE